MNHEERDSLGMYAAATVLDDTVPDRNRGTGPNLMGADTLLGNDVLDVYGTRPHVDPRGS
ncbi:MAG: hypothetical protein IV088_25940 [Hydrogenophaga sp.]|uniref:hypothetical protein n=1 Tax=Hydrogenophaga sp. TaxID=1904254 RepID=UPI0025B88F12|nr:hypothetical protein [Hydrogenophaga sp.]MBT9554299.1 hypothetical protein [Hydrogenophaga sp.]